MNAILYVFSGTGNTAKICSLYKETFEENGVATAIFPVTDGSDALPDPRDYDYVGFAYPIHAFNAPKNLLTLAKRLPAGNKKDYFILKSSGEPLKINNVSSLKFSDILKKKGYVLQSEYHYVMPYNMIFRHTDREAVRMWQTAKALCPLDARDVLAKKAHTLPSVPFGRFLAWVMRIEHPAMLVNGRFFRVKKDKCVLCKKCETVCPVGNITIDENGTFRFGGNCLMCTRCSFGCPTDALRIGILDAWRVNGAYPTEPTDILEPKHHHHRYCKKAYARYFRNAETRLRETE